MCDVLIRMVLMGVCLGGFLFKMDIFMLLYCVSDRFCGMGVVVMIKIFIVWFLVFSFICWVMLNLCCLLMIVSCRFVNLILVWNIVCVLISIWMLFLVNVVSFVWCLLFLFCLVNSFSIILVCFVKGCRLFRCCCVRIFVGVIMMFCLLVLIVVNSVNNVISVLFVFILFCNKWFIWIGVVIFVRILLIVLVCVLVGV